MKKNRLITAMALSLSLTLVSCSDDSTESNSPVAKKAVSEVATSVNQQSGLLDYIPADTPILFYYVNDPKHPIPQKFLDKMDNIFSSVGEIFKMSFLEGYKGYMTKANPDSDPKEIDAFMDKWFSEEGFDKLGFAMGETEFAMYAINLFPVVRFNLAKTHAMGDVLDELMAKANEETADVASKKDVNGATVYQLGDKEFQVIISLKGNELVASFAPTREVDNLMPTLFGIDKPAKSLVQSNNYQDTLSKYNYMGNSLVWLDVRKMADYFVNPSKYDSPMLDMMKVQDNVLSADCKTEILQIFDKFPRLVSGSTVLDDSNMDSHMIIEMADGLGGKLATLMGRIPAASGNPALSYGFSFDIAAAKTLALEFVTEIETAPYKCEMLTSMNDKAGMIKQKLNQPLPPFVGNFKGVNIVIDELDLDLSKTDPNEMVKNLKAKVLLAVDNPDALKGMAEMMMPDIQKLGLTIGGEAVNVSSLIPVSGSQMPVNLDFMFMAMGSETIGFSLGEGTNIDLVKDVSQKGASNLLNFRVEAELYKNIFEGISDMSDKFPAEVKKQFAMQKLMMNDLIWWTSESGSIDFTDRGFEIDVNYKY